MNIPGSVVFSNRYNYQWYCLETHYMYRVFVIATDT